MRNKVFKNQIRDMLEVYIDDMIVKSKEKVEHMTHLESIFREVRTYEIHLYLEKCTIRARSWKFMGY